MDSSHRVVTMMEMEAALAQQGHMVAGIDEAGRGPLAGPVVAACCALDLTKAQSLLQGLNDSKKISHIQREKLFPRIIDCCVSYGIASASVEEIESINILQATKLAMQRAVSLCQPMPTYLLVDGNQMIQSPLLQKTVVSGDALCLCIAAASVLAKVTRDRMMVELDELYPQYGFAGHKGYGAKAHIEAIRQHGPSPHHRLSFLSRIWP